MTSSVQLRWARRKLTQLSKPLQWVFPAELDASDAESLERDILHHYELETALFLVVNHHGSVPSVVPFRNIWLLPRAESYVLTTMPYLCPGGLLSRHRYVYNNNLSIRAGDVVRLADVPGEEFQIVDGKDGDLYNPKIKIRSTTNGKLTLTLRVSEVIPVSSASIKFPHHASSSSSVPSTNSP